MPPPPSGEVGGSFGVSKGYSDSLARTPYWKRMALSGSWKFRMKENTTHYPMSVHHPGEYDLRYTPVPYPDTHHPSLRPLLEIGEARKIPSLHIPVICLVNIFDDASKNWLGKRNETVYVPSHLARHTLLPQRWAVYATEEAYRLLGLPVKHHILHRSPVPKTREEYQKKILSRQHYEEERWQYDVEFLFRDYLSGKLPAELRDVWREQPGGRGREETQKTPAARLQEGEAEEEARRGEPLTPPSFSSFSRKEEAERNQWGVGGVEEALWMSQVYRGEGFDGSRIGAGEEGGKGGGGGGGNRQAGVGNAGRGLRKVRKAKKVKLF